LANIITGVHEAAPEAQAAAIQALRFYAERSAPNELVRLPWSRSGLRQLASASPEEVFPWGFRIGHWKLKARGVSELAALLDDPPLGDDEALRKRLRAVHGIRDERVDAAGVFGFRKPWPIVDEYFWRLLGRHGVLRSEEVTLKGYGRRRRAFVPHWQRLLAANAGDPNQVAATLYLWADEAEKFGFSYGGHFP